MLQPNERSFLTGRDPFIKLNPVDLDHRKYTYAMRFEPEHEGFIGIPHGGLGMGLCIDAWRASNAFAYPIDIRFKFGGSGISIGDDAIFQVMKDSSEGAFSAQIIKPGDKSPYLKAEIQRAAENSLYVDFDEFPSNARPLPYYRNCFVCGHHRSVPGLQRRFSVSKNGATVASAVWDGKSDPERSQYFLFSDDELHPAVITSIFDENTAWGGFMTTRTCGVSVRMDFRLLRPVMKSENLVFLGRPTGVRGNPKAPRFYLAEGAVYSLPDSGNPEPVACGKGEWLIMDHYTQQIKQNLLPEDDWQWLFETKQDSH